MANIDNTTPQPPPAQDPWATAETRYSPGQMVKGVVTRIAPFGVFVRIEEGLEGVLYQSRLAQEAGTNVREGQNLTLYVTSVDARRRRMELGFEPQMHPVLVEKSNPPFPPPVNLHPVADGCVCSACKKTVEASWKHCVYCGNTLQRVCTTCGTKQPVIEGARFCHECGMPLEGGEGK